MLNATNDKTEDSLLSDEELVALSQNGESIAIELLTQRYKTLVRSIARAFFLIGADRDDIIQEGMIGFFKAVRDFDTEKLDQFAPFAKLCVRRQIITAVKTATRQKHIPLNSYVSLNRPVYDDDSERTLLEVIAEGSCGNPEDLFIDREKRNSLRDGIKNTLSELEKKVLVCYLKGLSYQESAEEIDCHVKAVDNALQRVKRKMEKIVTEDFRT